MSPRNEKDGGKIDEKDATTMTVTKDDGDDHNSRVPNNTDRLMFWSVIPANSSQVYLGRHSYNVQLPVFLLRVG